MKKRISCLISAGILLSAGLMGCTSTLSAQPLGQIAGNKTDRFADDEAFYAPATHSFLDLGPYCKVQGRTVSDEIYGLCVDWTAAGIEFIADCKGDIVLKAMVPNRGDIYLTVWIDGVRSEKRLLADGSDILNELVLAEDLPAGRHTIKVLRQSEGMFQPMTFVSLDLNGKLLFRPKNNRYYIEFLGDSITAGYGDLLNVQVTGNNDEGTTLWEDGTQAYAYLTAEKLGADYSILAISGISVATGDPSSPMLYPYTSYYRNNQEEWGFERQADVVVVNLGTNDQVNQVSAEDFRTAAASYVALIREKTPDAAIVWVSGMMGTNFIAEVESVFAELGGEEAGYYTLVLPESRGGGHWHPNAAEQMQAAEMLTAFLEPILQGKD